MKFYNLKKGGTLNQSLVTFFTKLLNLFKRMFLSSNNKICFI